MTRTLNQCLYGIPVPDFDGDLTCTTVDAAEFPLRTPGWCVIELFPIWPYGPGEADMAGDFVDLAGIDGQLAEPFFRTGSRFDLDLVVTGGRVPDDPDSGPPYTFEAPSDPWAGLELNLSLLHANVLAPTLTGDGTRPFTLTLPSGDEATADVTVTPRLDLRDKQRWIHRYTMTIAIAAGRFVPSP